MRFLRTKRGVQLTLSTVVIAVLVIIVLIVLIVIFTKGTGSFFGGVTSCEDRGGTCVDSPQICTQSDGSVYRLGKCPQDKVCCVPESNLLKKDNENEWQ